MIKVGVVVQRYGEEVIGGAETLAKDVAERLNGSGFDVSVFTTTARDYITWENYFENTDSILKGVIVKRYSVERSRNIDKFNRISDQFFNHDKKTETVSESDWIDEQGPFSPDLINAIKSEQENFDIFIFFTYLYYTTVKAMEIIKKPVVLFPTAHDEPPLYLKVMKKVFNKPDALFFLTKAEMDLVADKFKPKGRMILSRTGVNLYFNTDENFFRRNYLIVAPFILYAGRIEKGKGLEQVFEAFREIRKRYFVDLVMMGKKLMEIPDIDGIKYVGFVSEEDKISAFKGAVCSVQPSHYESLSITTLESFTQQTPVLANGESKVLMEHIDSSGGGLPFLDANEFIKNFIVLFKNRVKRDKMGKKGFDYVNKYYSWDTVIKTISDQIREIVNI